MRNGPIVVVVGRGAALDLALGALEDLDLPVRVIPAANEASRALLRAERPRVKAVLVSLVEEPSEGLELVRSLRNGGGLGSVPLAVWVRAPDRHVRAEAYRLGASSVVPMDGTDEDPMRLARMIHYWAVANEYPAEADEPRRQERPA